MKFKKLYAENTYSYKELEIDFPEYAGATTIILGKNLDQKTSNGSGKTSILKTLFWVLWGKELYSASLENMINRSSENGMIARLTFEDRGYSYQITRWKDYKGSDTSKLKLLDNEKISGSGVEFLINGEILKGDTTSQTQKLIELKLRMSPKLFLSTILMAQKSDNHFLTANDTDKKEILSELLDLSKYAKAFDSVKKDITSLEKKINDEEIALKVLMEQKEVNLKEKLELEKSIKEHSDSLKNKEQEIKSRLKILETKKFEKKTIVDNRKELTEILTHKENELLKGKKAIEIHPKLITTIAGLESDIINIKTNLKAIGDNSLKLQEEILTIEKGIVNITPFDSSLLTNKEAELKKLKDLEKTLHHEKTFFNNLKSKEKDLTKKIDELKKKIEDLVKTTKCPECERGFSEGDSHLSSLKSKLDEELISLENDLNKVVEDLSHNLYSLEKEEKAHKDLIAIENELSSLSKNKIENEKQLLSNKLKEENITSLKSKVLEGEESLRKESESLAKKEERLKEANVILSGLKTSLDLVDSLEKEVATLRKEIFEKESEILQIKKDESEAFEAKKEVERLKNELKEIEKNSNPFNSVLERLLKQMELSQDKENLINKRLEKYKEEYKYLNFCRVMFSPTGIRSFITDDVIGLLNKKTSEYLFDLFDGALNIIFDPESTNSKGLVSNKISTKILLNGEETEFSLLSGGEQERAILATNLALTDIAEARSGTKLSIRFLDEPTTGIDDNGQVKSLALFNKLARDKDGFFIISHDEKFQNLCQKGIYVVKHRKNSKIVAKHEFLATSLDMVRSEPVNTSSMKIKDILKN